MFPGFRGRAGADAVTGFSSWMGNLFISLWVGKSKYSAFLSHFLIYRCSNYCEVWKRWAVNIEYSLEGVGLRYFFSGCSFCVTYIVCDGIPGRPERIICPK